MNGKLSTSSKLGRNLLLLALLAQATLLGATEQDSQSEPPGDIEEESEDDGFRSGFGNIPTMGGPSGVAQELREQDRVRAYRFKGLQRNLEGWFAWKKRVEPIRFAVGLTNVVHVFHEAYYTALDGGVLEAFAKLLAADVKFYVLPRTAEDLRSALESLEGGAELWSLPDAGIATVENIEPTTRLRHLYHYMCETGTLVTVEAS